MKNSYDYIVIGSGFGGSVASLRLAEKGYSVLTLEKGKRWRTKDFPKTNWNIRKYIWLPVFGCFGFQKLNLFKHAFILSGAGVGGGSLAYANTLMEPLDSFFTNKQWSELEDWKTVLKPCYEKAAFMLGRTKFACKNTEDELLQEVAIETERSKTFDSVQVAVYFSDDQTPNDPYFNGAGPLRNPCTHCAGCMVGCRENAKNTLDKNYLWFAEKKGAEILPETEVWKIEYRNGEYLIHTRKTGGLFKRNRKIFKAKGLVVSGGVLGTVKLLLNQKYNLKTLSGLSDTLGKNVRTNSETLCTATFADRKMNNGIAISSIFSPDENTSVEVVKYPNGSNLMRLLLTIATDKKGSTGLRILHFAGEVVLRPVKFLRMMFNSHWAENTIIFLVMQTVDTKMNFVLKRWPFNKRITLKNDGNDKVQAYIPVGQDIMHRYAKKINALPQNSTAEILMNVPSTAHILGGIPMGKKAETGVIGSDFRVHNYPEMFILDGSAIQGNLGVNPSFTITALAEYAMSKIQEKE